MKRVIGFPGRSQLCWGIPEVRLIVDGSGRAIIYDLKSFSSSNTSDCVLQGDFRSEGCNL